MRIVPLPGAVMISQQSCAPSFDRGAFLAYLGSDTLAVEAYFIDTNRIEASVMLRKPATSLQEFALEFDDAGNMRRFEATVRDPASPEAPPRRKDLLQASKKENEIFKIAIEENDRQAELQLKWDQTAYTVPFTVKN